MDEQRAPTVPYGWAFVFFTPPRAFQNKIIDVKKTKRNAGQFVVRDMQNNKLPVVLRYQSPGRHKLLRGDDRN